MPTVVPLRELLQRERLEHVETLKEDYDHHLHVVRRDGRLLVLKLNARPELQRGLEREVSAALSLRVLERAQEGWSVGTSAPLVVGEGWLLREHVDRPQLLSDERTSEQAARRAGRALADLDRLAPDPATSRPSWRDPDGEPVATAQDRARELARWLQELRGAVPDDLGERLDRARERTKPGFEVWDVKTDDLLDLPDGRVGLYDLEWAHPFGRRYYDLGVLAVALALGHGQPRAGAGLLGAFLDGSPLPAREVDAAAAGVLAEAVLARLHDEGPERAPDLLPLLEAALGGGASGLRDALAQRGDGRA